MAEYHVGGLLCNRCASTRLREVWETRDFARKTPGHMDAGGMELFNAVMHLLN